ncbi:MAG: nuclear transport factor 2 family protein [Bacteroidota bacterium]|nr:nuclear transport factor 2 family protein [Bacteroidota bacterium]
MQNPLIKLLFGILFFGFINASNAQTASGVSNVGLVKEVDSAFSIMVNAAVNNDIATLARGVDDSQKAGFIINGVYYTLFSDIIDNMKTGGQGDVKQLLTLQNKKITLLTDNLALLTANGVAHVTVNGGNPFDADFFWTLVLKKINNQWKVIQSHQSRK